MIPLPEPENFLVSDDENPYYLSYTPDQMHAYGAACAKEATEAKIAEWDAWAQEGEKIMRSEGMGFRLGVWWGSRPWRKE